MLRCLEVCLQRFNLYHGGHVFILHVNALPFVQLAFVTRINSIVTHVKHCTRYSSGRNGTRSPAGTAAARSTPRCDAAADMC